MILDDIIAGLMAIFEILFEGVIIVIEPLVNLIAAGIEMVVQRTVLGSGLESLSDRLHRPAKE